MSHREIMHDSKWDLEINLINLTYHRAPRGRLWRTWVEGLLAREPRVGWSLQPGGLEKRPTGFVTIELDLPPSLPRIQPFATNVWELTVHIMFKEHSCLMLTFNNMPYDKKAYGGSQQYIQTIFNGSCERHHHYKTYLNNHRCLVQCL